MREELLHFIWKHKKFRTGQLRTTLGYPLQIRDLGTHNFVSGPDFLNARIEIDSQLWVGNVEIHIKSSDWYGHHHDRDENYNNVILHLVWKEDVKVYRATGEEIHTLVLSDYVEESLLDNYRGLLEKSGNRFINCEAHAREFPVFLVLPWMEHLFRERLDAKTSEAALLLKETNGDWERLLFIMLLSNFGHRLNRSCFLDLARTLDFNIIRQLCSSPLVLESLLFGLSGLLSAEPKDKYQAELKREFSFLIKKYKLRPLAAEPPEFMRVRPGSFPTIRLSQFAALYTGAEKLFSKIVMLRSKSDFYELFAIEAAAYWENHYVFGIISRPKKKSLSSAFKDNLIINTVLPLKNLYARERGENIYSQLRNLISRLRKEDNRIVRQFQSLGFPAHHALDTQALIRLHSSYCTKNRCLNCALGNQILN
jgi:hypothetical protein